MNYSEISPVSTLVDLLRYRATYQPDQTAYTFLVDGETEAVHLTYHQLEQRAQVVAAYLQTKLVPGDRALLLYQPGLEYIVAFFGCLYAGVVAIPAYPPRPNRSLSRILSILYDAHAQVALTSGSILSMLQRRRDPAPSLETLHWLATDTLGTEASDFHPPWLMPELTSETLAFLQYTSGSTATPKGVMITHRNLLHNLGLIHRCFEHHSHSQGVIWLPPYHDMGLIGGVLQPLYGGFPVTLMSPLMFLQSPIRWLQAISRYRATTSGGPNFAFDLCVRKISPQARETLDLSTWEVAFNGAEPICAETLEQFTRTFRPCGFRPEAFYPCYGMAEATLIVSGGKKSAPPVVKTVQAGALEQHRVVPVTSTDEGARTLVGCGQQLPDETLVIVNPETLVECPPGEVGEIWVSGPSIAQGYWQKPAETEETFNAYLKGSQSGNGQQPAGPFLRTGDLGFLEAGELFVTGRLKDLIIINGANHYPQDIEWTVEQSHSLIRPNCTAAFSVDVAGEERLVVIAEIDPRYRDTVSITDPSNFQDLLQSIQRAVSKNHDLQVHTTLLLKAGEIPKTSSGKIRRHACRASFLAGTLRMIDTICENGT